LPVDVLKLDRGFVAEIDQSLVDRRIVRTVVALGHTLGLKVVAEGVERQSQAELLARCGVDVAQGFYYARPMEGAWLVAWLKRVGSAPNI
jgi:EAL domain-containing protein (putative c-di-GMP-specific phosphodiesterase class I)